ncbi:hypothetical protein Slala03_36530 [Streptomyces lavendulae subsp. lavendulae]|uniref:hypothetical protein n=1 Tax=Streptomyces lavendulae TaxID=1914 RepID=UPI0024A04984|nr:hypothetical protein [Streptomyces lavendulae]GLV83964.1 hypothetical protein Slala03_36530 [Streptomyces lavendulae subsp. lavendulae]GLX37915.1 hypothetical protein Sros01_39880 [Streptomyces roseochromogenus]
MTYLPRRAAAAATAVAALFALVTGCSGAEAPAPAAEAPAAAASPVALPAPRSAPSPAAVLTPAPTAGEVRVQQGPFTDRVQLTGLRLTASPSSVTGHVAIGSDVSDTLALEITAAYYDAEGRLLGTGTFHHAEEGEEAHAGQPHTGPRAAGDGIDFTVPADHLTGTPAGAVLSIPVLVNE